MNETNQAREPHEIRPPVQSGTSKPWYARASTWIGGVAGSVIAGIILAVILNSIGLGGSREPLSKAGPSRSASSAAPTRSTSGNPTVGMVSFGALNVGDCITGQDLRLADSNVAWPTEILVVPCTESHAGEVIFSADYWPATEAYPGTQTVDNQGWDKCEAAFRAYVGTIYDYSVFRIAWNDPSNAEWLSNERNLLCVAYDPSGSLSSSVRGTRQ